MRMCQVIHYQDAGGEWFREFIESSYDALAQLRSEYKKKGFETWLNLYSNSTNSTPAKWMLTVRTGKEQS